MPTPKQYANQSNAIRPIDGVIPGLTWDQFLSQAQPFNTTLGAGQRVNLGNQGYVLGMPGSGGGALGAEQGGTGFAPMGGPMVYMQDVGDGTRNTFYRGDNGELLSKNETQNNDSWWDSTGLPLVASLAFGGATAGLAAGGIGVSGAGAGAVNVGAGFGANSLQALGAGGGTSLASGAGSFQGLGAGNDFTGTGFGNGTGVDTIGGQFAGYGAEGQALQTAVTVGGGGGVGGLSAAELSALAAGGGLASAGLSALSGGGGESNYDPTSKFIQPTNATQATQDIAKSGNSLINTPTTTNPLQAISNLYNNGLTNGSLSDYWQLASGAGSLLNGILGYSSANKAADAQTNAANQSNQLAASIYANNTAMAKPFVDGGTSAFNQQSNLNGLNGAAAQTAARGQFQTDPGYQFRMDQGNHAVQSSAAAAGGLYSGRAAKDLQNYSQGLASQEYGNYFSRLTGQANLGQAAAAGQAAQGNNYVNNVTSNNAAIGNAQAAGGIAGTNAITGSISNILGQGSNNQLLNLLRGQGNGYYNTGTF